MTDIYNIEKPFGLLDHDTQRELVQACERNVDVEVYTPSGWYVHRNLTFNKAVAYRAVRPVPTPDIVPWEALADWVEWVARTEGSQFFGYENEPEIDVGFWRVRRGNCAHLAAVRIIPGTCDWSDSLQRRPRKAQLDTPDKPSEDTL